MVLGVVILFIPDVDREQTPSFPGELLLLGAKLALPVASYRQLSQKSIPKDDQRNHLVDRWPRQHHDPFVGCRGRHLELVHLTPLWLWLFVCLELYHILHKKASPNGFLRLSL